VTAFVSLGYRTAADIVHSIFHSSTLHWRLEYSRALTNRIPKYFQDVDQCVDEILARIGKHIVLGIPVGLGKPNQLVNALFNRAMADRSIELRILTALTLERPTGATELERAFLVPFIALVYGDYPDLEYARALHNDALPPNIKVAEFFFTPGAYIKIAAAQQNYIRAL
jgi:hypothetical protein